MNILVTGANGFIGTALAKRLLREGWNVRGAVRSVKAAESVVAGTELALTGEIGPHTDWYAALHGIDAVVHLAARVHVMSDADPQSPRAYHEVNTAGTERLARAAADMRVKRLVYVSTIKVNEKRPMVAPSPRRTNPGRRTSMPFPNGKLKNACAGFRMKLAWNMSLCARP